MARPADATALAMAAALALAALLAGCENHLDYRDTVSLHAGEAVATNRALQTIDPWPAAARDTRIGGDGERARIAVERYKANKVLPPQGLGTSSIKVAPSGLGAPQGGAAGPAQ